MAQFDLTKQISAFLDRHMCLSLVEFLHQETELYPKETLNRSKLELLSKTKMIDWIKNIHVDLGTPESELAFLLVQRNSIVDEIRMLEDASRPLLNVIETPDLWAQLKRDEVLNMKFLESQYQVTESVLESFYKLAKLKFDIGSYSDTADFMYFYRVLCGSEEKVFQSIWGKLAAEIMLESEVALQDLYYLRDLVESRSYPSPVMQLQHRTWLLHWGLFVFFNTPQYRPLLLEFFMQEKYLNAIQVNCPHLLRYLASAVIISHHLTQNASVLKNVVTIINQESHLFRDPITEFLVALLVEFDFELALFKLKEAYSVCRNDFFLLVAVEEFMNACRFLYFETYLKIHKSIDVRQMSESLAGSAKYMEEWAEKCSPSHTVRKIENGVIRWIAQEPSVYDQISEKLAPINVRMINVMQNLDKHSG